MGGLHGPSLMRCSLALTACRSGVTACRHRSRRSGRRITGNSSGPSGVAWISRPGSLGFWDAWIERWRRTSTLDSRDNLRLHLYKLGRWLGIHHPEVVAPDAWTRDLCAEYVAAACRMRVGDYTVRKVAHARTGEPLAPRAIAAELVAARILLGLPGVGLDPEALRPRP